MGLQPVTGWAMGEIDAIGATLTTVNDRAA
jgi:hypothetical protein